MSLLLPPEVWAALVELALLLLSPFIMIYVASRLLR